MGNSYFDEKLHFAQIEYGKQPPFSGFLPGIPAWCNYNDRGQVVCSFSMQDKDHVILEFTASSTAYRNTAQTGFRTFLKRDGAVIDSFADSMGTMSLKPNVLRLEWKMSERPLRSYILHCRTSVWQGFAAGCAAEISHPWKCCWSCSTAL